MAKKHEFEKLPDFDIAMRKLVSSPKETGKPREKTSQRKKKVRK